MAMRFGLLGPLTIEADDGTPLEVRGAKLRVLLATLLCHANQPVPGDALIAAVWGPTPPRRADASLRVYVHHLRQTLGAARIVRSASGYRIVVHAGELDLDRFRELMAGDHSVAEALALWRGPALSGFTDVPALSAEAGALEELRLDALEQRFELDLAHGRHAEITAELRGLANQHPLRESLRGQLMRALVAGGRAAEAVAVYEETRQLLAGELGMEPTAQLRDLHLAILREDPALQRPPAGAEPVADPDDQPTAAGRIVPRQLPADLAGFSGRDEPLRALDDALEAAEDAATNAGRIAVVTGTAGVGKTTLAVHWAHRIAARFPDGQLYVNLHGFDPARKPVDPAAALALFLDTLGVPPRRIPAGTGERATLYRELVKERRLLVVLDNAHDADQVEPLLPKNNAGFTVITSRIRIRKTTIGLDLLTRDESRRLLRTRIGPRADAEPDAVDTIVDRCAGLPLALSIAASRAALASRTPLAGLAGELARTRPALDGFASDDASIDLRAVFSWSYRVLPDPVAALFRLLALHPGPDATAQSAAGLAGVPVETAVAALTALCTASLLGEPLPGRFAFHDLLHAYAEELSESVDERAALNRVLRHFVTATATAVRVLDARQEPVDVDDPGPAPALDGNEAALKWFRAERPVLLAAVTKATGGFADLAWRLAWNVGFYLEVDGDWRTRAAVLLEALPSAERAGPPDAPARLHRAIGLSYGRLHDHDRAAEHTGTALRLFRELGDRPNQAHCLGILGSNREEAGRYREAIAAAEEAYRLYIALGDEWGQAKALVSKGWLHSLVDEYGETVALCSRAIPLLIAAGDRMGQAAALDSIGYAHLHLGRPREAITYFRRSIEALPGAGFQYFEAISLEHLGDAYHVIGELSAARQAWQGALGVFTRMEAPQAPDLRTKLAALNRQLAPVLAVP
jgi:DNA-binding SARP family transcriptional activator/tetratricopeptide (TPR) repeat protein